MLSQKGELSKITEDVDNWMKMIRQLSHDTSCEKEVEQTLSIISKIDDDKIRIAFIGAPNSGKSSIINRLLERKIIPVTVLSSATEFEIRPTANEQIESFSFGGMSKPLKEFKETVSSLEEKSEFGSFVLTISSNWLNSKPFVLLEKTPLDPSNKNVEEVVDEYLRNLDVIILVVDALMPVKRAEAILLKECVKREIPVIVILSKIDKIPPDERDNVVTYVKKFVGSCSTDIPVLAIQANVENDTFGTDNLKVLIENLVERVDIQQIRNRQVANTLLKSIEVIRNTAQMSLEIQKRMKKR